MRATDRYLAMAWRYVPPHQSSQLNQPAFQAPPSQAKPSQPEPMSVYSASRSTASASAFNKPKTVAAIKSLCTDLKSAILAEGLPLKAFPRILQAPSSADRAACDVFLGMLPEDITAAAVIYARDLIDYFGSIEEFCAHFEVDATPSQRPIGVNDRDARAQSLSTFGHPSQYSQYSQYSEACTPVRPFSSTFTPTPTLTFTNTSMATATATELASALPACPSTPVTRSAASVAVTPPTGTPTSVASAPRRALTAVFNGIGNVLGGGGGVANAVASPSPVPVPASVAASVAIPIRQFKKSATGSCYHDMDSHCSGASILTTDITGLSPCKRCVPAHASASLPSPSPSPLPLLLPSPSPSVARAHHSPRTVHAPAPIPSAPPATYFGGSGARFLYATTKNVVTTSDDRAEARTWSSTVPVITLHEFGCRMLNAATPQGRVHGLPASVWNEIASDKASHGKCCANK